MIEVGSFATRDCFRSGRRAFLRAGFGIPFAAGLPLPGAAALADEESIRAKSIILLWLWGGPSHLDTFDPKPNATLAIRGPLAPIATRTPGVQFSELFPQLARRSHLFSLVRTNVNSTNVHRIAGSIALTGAEGRSGDDGYGPNFGSVVQRLRGNQIDLPPFIAVSPGTLQTAAGLLKGFGGGSWGRSYDPFPVHCDDLGTVDLPTLKLLDGLTVDRLEDRRRLLGEIDSIARHVDSQAETKWHLNQLRAYRLIASPDGRRAFDLSRESDSSRNRFGRTQFGQSCLLARRLVEAGTSYVQVNWSKWVENIYDGRTDFGWDTHWLNFEHLADRHGPILDRALSALLDDLDERGLLETTLVLAMGEFGRTPKISGNGGRDHWANCYCSLWAGGGVRPGRIIGTSDQRGYEPLTEPITPGQVGATVLELAGIRTEQRAQLQVLEDARPIDGLI